MHPAETLRAVAHRPWPLPHEPWVMAQTWCDVLLAHWPVDAALLRPRVPGGLALQTAEGQAWLTLVPFRMRGLRPRGVPAMPYLSAFEQINLRTYVVADGMPGVFFFSVHASRALLAAAARMAFHLPYASARFTVRDVGGGLDFRVARRQDAPKSVAFAASYRPSGPEAPAAPGSLEHWLTERYCLYSADARGRLYRAQIHHAPWSLRPAAVESTAQALTAPLGLALATAPALAHYAARMDVLVWPLRPLAGQPSGRAPVGVARDVEQDAHGGE